MPTYSTPGVYVNESLLSSLAPSATGALSTAVFYGEAERGPLVPTLISDWSSYKSVFGDLKTQYDLGYSVYHFFANGGRNCYIQRVLGTGAVAAKYTAFPYFPTGTGQASAGLFTATAISPGTWGNAVSVATLNGSTRGIAVPAASAKFGTFTLVVSVGGVEVERWLDLSQDPANSKYAPTVVNTYSKFIRLSNLAVGSASAGVADYVIGNLTMTTGTQGSAVADADYNNTLPLLDQLTGNLLLNAVGQVGSTLITAFVNKAASRGDSFVIIDPDPADLTVADITASAATFSASNPGYAAQYVPRLLMVDPSKTGPGAVRITHPGGAVAGLYVRTEVERNVAKAPAGYFADIRGALGLDIVISDTDIGVLYDGTPQVNSFKAIAGAGVVCWGARTLNKSAPDKYVSVRRTMNYLKASLKAMTLPSVFEPNDERLWVKLNMSVSGFLTVFWRAGGLKGERASDAFYVVCDSTINTPNSIDQGVVNIAVGVALQYPAEFIVINISQWSGGSNVVESI